MAKATTLHDILRCIRGQADGGVDARQMGLTMDAEDGPTVDPVEEPEGRLEGLEAVMEWQSERINELVARWRCSSRQRTGH
jgi:hypothetical protein